MQAPFVEKEIKNSERGLALTSEQQAIIKSQGDIVINAVAGSGKTSTIIQYAASRPKGKKILYLAFNRSVKLEAKKRFSQLGLHGVEVETAHSLAYKHIVTNSGFTISPKGYTSYEIANKLKLTGNGEIHGEYVLANHILRFLVYFCNSAAEKVQHLNYIDVVSDPKAKTFVSNFYSQIELGTRTLLGMMHRGEIEIIHDFYLKMFQLSKPRLHFDYILFDEGQDASPAMLDIFLHQPEVKVIVGDANQQVYGWRHAINSLEKVNYKAYELSASFRFNQAVADLSMQILSWKKHFQKFHPVTIEGMGKPSVVKTKATIARTNLGLLLSAITFISEKKWVKHIYFEGNINSYTYADEGASLYDVLNLFNGKKERIKDNLISSMHNLKDLEDYIKKTEDIQLSMMVDIVKEYGNDIPSLIKSLKNKHVGDDEKEKAEMIFSTVHRAKGMEYDEVTLVEDFITETELERMIKESVTDEAARAKWNEEINLLYVASTRTKGILNIPENLLPKNFTASANIKIIRTGDSSEQPLAINAKPDSRTNVNRSNNKKQNVEGSFSYLEKRMKHKNAYERWTPEKDSELRTMYYKGIKIISLTEHFGRNEGAILSRLKKLGCIHFD